MEQLWWNSGAVIVEKRNSYGGTVAQWNSETVEKRWWNSGTMMVEQRNSDGGTEEQLW